MAPDEHERFARGAVDALSRDPRLAGLALGGSWIGKRMDEFSDLDFVVAVKPAHVSAVMNDRQTIAGGLGKLLCAFTGEHVGEPRLLICLYDDPLLHVDLKFVSVADFAHRVEDPEVLWDRDGDLARALASSRAEFPRPDVQWIEDRFWTFVHYGATKLGRGEYFEVVGFLAFLRDRVLGPMCAARHGLEPRGVRRLEFYAREERAKFEATLCRNDRRDCGRALVAAVALYRELRQAMAPPDLTPRTAAETSAVAYLDAVVRRDGEAKDP
jgi:hypothetical protein